jgi:triacylglycerol lipase
MLHRVYLSPGMFGFGRLASYDYFVHLEKAIGDRIRAAGDQVKIHVAHVMPNASIRRRALKLAELVSNTCIDDRGPIHLVGHSTGGLDARLVASPTVSLGTGCAAQTWLDRLSSVTTINTPHYGTPLASFFTTVSGQRALRALSALTVVALSVGAPPLAAVGALVAAFGRVDKTLGFKLKMLDRATELLLRQIDDVRSPEIRQYVDAVRVDNGAMVQLMPEAMDLFLAGVEDRAGVLYQSTVSTAPSPSPRTFLHALTGPWRALSGAIFALIYGITARYDPCYPCAAPAMPDIGPSTRSENDRALTAALGHLPDLRANDGAVPIRSQIWGRLVWAGYADHLDVLGHFDGSPPGLRFLRPRTPPGEAPHVDWLSSGSGFDRARFASLMDAIAAGMLESVRAPQRATGSTSL